MAPAAIAVLAEISGMSPWRHQHSVVAGPTLLTPVGAGKHVGAAGFLSCGAVSTSFQAPPPAGGAPPPGGAGGMGGGGGQMASGAAGGAANGAGQAANIGMDVGAQVAPVAGDAAVNAGGAAASAAESVGGAVAGAAPGVLEGAASAGASAAEAGGEAASSAGDSGGCFPASATVQERSLGAMRIADVRVGHELASGQLPAHFSRVVAMLHRSEEAVVDCIRVSLKNGSQLCATPEHLIRVRRKRRVAELECSAGALEAGAIVLAAVAPSRLRPLEAAWGWLPIEDIRLGDEVAAVGGDVSAVELVERTSCLGMYAPLTLDSMLIVDGVLCSCFAPPVAWRISHAMCHAAMLPLRLLASLRETVETWSQPGDDCDDPLLSVDAIWLLPTVGVDDTIHPYVAGFAWAEKLTLRTVAAMRAAAALPNKQVDTRASATVAAAFLAANSGRQCPELLPNHVKSSFFVGT